MDPEPPTAAEREAGWALLDKRPVQSEITSYDREEIAEIRRITEKDLRQIARLSGTESALNKDTKAFLDTSSIVRALARVGEERYEQGTHDAASKSLINALRWQQVADRLHHDGDVTLPRINAVRLWHLLAEIYVSMGEQDLALKTLQKANAGIEGVETLPFPGLLSTTDPDTPSPAADEDLPQVGNGGGSVGDLANRAVRYLSSRNRRTWLIVAAVIVVGVLAFTAFRAQVNTKSMIDHSSLGVDYLNIAYNDAGHVVESDGLILAAQEFAALDAKLESWAWATTLSSVFPPAHDQFVAMNRMADLGANLVAAPSAGTGGRLAGVGSPMNVCSSADRLRNFDGNLINQLEKNRTEMLQTVDNVLGPIC